jgi:hypothetical protein
MSLVPDDGHNARRARSGRGQALDPAQETAGGERKEIGERFLKCAARRLVDVDPPPHALVYSI